MVAALLRVVHSGPQNERLNNTSSTNSSATNSSTNPSAKFFMKIFKKPGRFTTQWVRLDFNTLPKFGAPASVSLPRKGHLLSRLYLVANFPTVASNAVSWTNSVGHALIANAELQIGGARIEQMDGQLMEVLDEFNTPLEKVPVVNRLIGRTDNGYQTKNFFMNSNLVQFSNITSYTQVFTHVSSNITSITSNLITSNLIVTSNYTYSNSYSNTFVWPYNYYKLGESQYINILYGSNQDGWQDISNNNTVQSNDCIIQEQNSTAWHQVTTSYINSNWLPSDYIPGSITTVHWNFKMDVLSSSLSTASSCSESTFHTNPGDTITFEIKNVGSYTFSTNYGSNYTPLPSNFNISYEQTVSNVYLSNGTEFIVHLSNTTTVFANLGLQIYFDYATALSNPNPILYNSNWIPCSNLIIHSNYTFTSNYNSVPNYSFYNEYVQYSNYLYQNPLSNPLTTATPLPFFFSRNDASAALPIDAIQADEIRILFNFRPFSSLYYITPNGTATPNGATEGSALQPPTTFSGAQINPLLGDTYLLAEYIYLDAPEANRFRIGDISLPITQHYPLQATDTQGRRQVEIQVAAPNPVRDIFFYCQPFLGPAYNAHFLATKYIGSTVLTAQPWWPDAQGLNPLYPSPLKPAFYPDIHDSEPLQAISLQYEGRLTKFSTQNPALFRAILPSLEQKKAPWVNRYYYNIPFGVQHGYTPRTQPTGEVNYDKITRRELQVLCSPNADGSYPRLWIRPWVETYNVLRIYGGRAGTLFGY